ncbi:hypothetical protein DIPPA_31544 [Diplonema papillatum]|nr:hypothetical protein DIPPA_31544 [Diplonema papillatum]
MRPTNYDAEETERICSAVRHGLQPCGHTWNGGPPSSVDLDGAALRPLAMSASERNHIIRDNLRNRL